MLKSRNEKSRKADATKNQFELGPGDPDYSKFGNTSKMWTFFSYPKFQTLDG